MKYAVEDRVVDSVFERTGIVQQAIPGDGRLCHVVNDDTSKGEEWAEHRDVYVVAFEAPEKWVGHARGFYEEELRKA